MLECIRGLTASSWNSYAKPLAVSSEMSLCTPIQALPCAVLVSSIQVSHAAWRTRDCVVLRKIRGLGPSAGVVQS
jgi:hypothetical protein